MYLIFTAENKIVIDWKLTEEQLNRTNISGYRPKVICRCDRCKTIQKITIRIKSRVVDDQMDWECPKCVGSRPAVKKKLSKIKRGKLKAREGTPYRRHYLKHREKLLQKNRLRRKKKENTCKLCSLTLPRSEFYINNTYMSPVCNKCDKEAKLIRDRARALYAQQYYAKNSNYNKQFN